ncbi:MAG: carbon storage regulator CsrA [Sedimentisphaerales bacterium]|nr:carbon storage regulator CsrA [Sedimentisphaerales bacterium]
MLVLSRQRDESIMIGDDVEITIVDVRGDKVRLGITAPKSIPVHRREIYDAIQREKAEKAAGTESQDKSPAEQNDSTEEADEKEKAKEHQKH